MSTDPASASGDVAGGAYREAHAASEGDEMAQQVTDSVDAEERAREQAMGEVSDVLTNLDYALERARKALVSSSPECTSQTKKTEGSTVLKLKGASGFIFLSQHKPITLIVKWYRSK